VIAWHVYPLGFAGAPIRGGAAQGDTRPDLDASAEPPLPTGLRHLAGWLDYAADLGFDTLSLGPVFASQTHGYDTTDHRRIDPRLGTEADFGHLIGQAHARGMKVLLDGVFNHVGEEHPLWREALGDGPGRDAARAMFRWEGERPAVFEGHSSLLVLDHASDQVAAWVGDIMAHWLERGLDGWRLDAAYATGPDFWARVLPGLRQRFPGAYFFGELIHGDAADFIARSTLDSITQYPLWKAIWSSLKDRNFFELEWALRGHNSLLAEFAPVTFVGNHDVTRIATQVGHGAAALATTALLTLGGSPHIYYGDELGLTGLKEDREGGDDAVRPAFPLRPPDGIVHRGAQDRSRSGELGASSPAGSGFSPDLATHALHRSLIRWRAANPWLERAPTEVLELANQRLVYRTANPAGSEAVTVTLDLTDLATPRAWANAPDLNLSIP
jgi:glycosidase